MTNSSSSFLHQPRHPGILASRLLASRLWEHSPLSRGIGSSCSYAFLLCSHGPRPGGRPPAAFQGLCGRC